jgi:hypothetical protein
MTIGPSSASLSLRDGGLDATLADMQLYDGQGSGKFTLDASKPVPTFAGNLALKRSCRRSRCSTARQGSTCSPAKPTSLCN